MSFFEESKQLLLKQLSKKGSAADMIEKLGLRTSGARHSIPSLEDAVTRNLYNCLSSKVNLRSEVLKTHEDVKKCIENPLFLEEDVEDILREFGAKLWGRDDRSHLLETEKPGLYIDNPGQRNRIKLYLKGWIVTRLASKISNRATKAKTKRGAKEYPVSSCPSSSNSPERTVPGPSRKYSPNSGHPSLSRPRHTFRDVRNRFSTVEYDPIESGDTSSFEKPVKVLKVHHNLGSFNVVRELPDPETTIPRPSPATTANYAFNETKDDPPGQIYEGIDFGWSESQMDQAIASSEETQNGNNDPYIGISRAKLCIQLIDLFLSCGNNYDKNAEVELDSFLSLLFSKDTGILKEKMGTTLFDRRRIAFFRWLEMRRDIAEFREKVDFEGHPGERWAEIYRHLSHAGWREGLEGVKEINILKQKFESDPLWEDFDEDVACMLNELVDVQEWVAAGGGFRDSVREYRKYLMLWFTGKSDAS